MHLDTLSVKNFRSFIECEVPLGPELTIFVGENNGGKSNIIDAIRLLTAPLGGRRELYCEPTDVRFGSSTRRFEIEGRFTNLNPAQQGRLLSAAADESLEAAVFGFTYEPNENRFPARPAFWAGRGRGSPEQGSLQTIRHVYLPPLRDARRALASGNPTRVYALLQHFLGDADPDAVARSMAPGDSHDILKKIDAAVESRLGALTTGVRRQAASLGFGTQRLIDVARDLRFKLADHGIAPEDLQHSGHGYANLLYIATIAVELEKVRTADLTLFLVEEPEAHLHPQLQAAVLSFLKDEAVRSHKRASAEHDTRAQDTAAPSGELQIIIASHSPNLSASIEANKLVVFKSVPRETRGTVGPPASDDSGALPRQPGEGIQEAAIRTARPSAELRAEPEASMAPDLGARARPATRCVPLSRLDLSEVQWRKINRYLDVTKSALLFGGRVLLVEGIAEALLIPEMARSEVLNDEGEKLQVFRSAVFVPIDGVDFEPYVRLLLTPVEGVRIGDRLVIVTDGDVQTSSSSPSPGEKRKQELEAIARNVGAGDFLAVHVSKYSLETELVLAGNGDVLREIYLSEHTRSANAWDEAIAATGQEQAKRIQKLFDSTRKGDFAQRLAEKISCGAHFRTPEYIKEAIRALVQ